MIIISYKTATNFQDLQACNHVESEESVRLPCQKHGME